MSTTSTQGQGSVRGAALLPQPGGTVEFLPHAEITWCDARFTEIRALAGEAPLDAPLLLPGFVDLHCHWPQSHIRGQFQGQLLPWLRDAIWPAESGFLDLALARTHAQRFLAEATRAGTCAGLFFGPPFAEATAIFLEETPRGFFEGPAIMSRNAPPPLLRPARQTLAMLRALEDPRVSIAPRFAPNLDVDGLRACGDVARETGWPVQSHLSENTDEMAWVHTLFVDARDYTDVYERAGLLGPRTVLAHGIHLSDRELVRLAATGTLLAHCPTSNEALGSGRMPLERLRSAGVPWVLATDVGAGPKLSQLHVMQGFLQAHAGHADVRACEALARVTAIPGAWLARFDPLLTGLGTFQVGAPAHVVALPRTPARGKSAESLLLELLALPAAALETLPRGVVLWGEQVAGQQAPRTGQDRPPD